MSDPMSRDTGPKPSVCAECGGEPGHASFCSHYPPIRHPAYLKLGERNKLLQRELDGRTEALKRSMAKVDGLEQKLRAAEEQRDRAIAHDSQPYPTASAYEQACKALNEKTERIARLEEALELATDFIANAPHSWGGSITIKAINRLAAGGKHE